MATQPNMRRELIFHLRELADLAYQQQVWLNGEQPIEDGFYSIDAAIAFLFDDLWLDVHPENQVGLSLENTTELEALRPLIHLLDGLLTEHGIVPFDSDFVRSPQWSEVVAAARQAYRVLEPDKEPEGLFEDVQAGFFDEQLGGP